MVWIIGLVALPSNPYIFLGLIRHCGLISRTWQIVSANSSSIKPYPMAQVSAKVIALILFPSVYCIVKKLSQKRFFGIKDEEIIRLFSSSLERVTLFPDQCFRYCLYLKHL